MKTILETKLNDGAELTVVRLIIPDELGSEPDWMYDFVIHELPEQWFGYYRSLMDGKNTGCRDFIYAGIVDGVPCSRMWFGYSQKTGSGNFGNVLTLPEFRRRGLMGKILECCIEDFYQTEAKFISCDAAAAAAPAYAASGFQRIVDPNKKPMALLAKKYASFAEITAEAYADTANAVVRPGEMADRFDCDKLLPYVPEVYFNRPTMPDYITSYFLLNQQTAERPVVLEAASGCCAGFRFQGKIMLHPAFESYRKKLENA